MTLDELRSSYDFPNRFDLLKAIDYSQQLASEKARKRIEAKDLRTIRYIERFSKKIFKLSVKGRTSFRFRFWFRVPFLDKGLIKSYFAELGVRVEFGAIYDDGSGAYCKISWSRTQP